MNRNNRHSKPRLVAALALVIALGTGSSVAGSCSNSTQAGGVVVSDGPLLIVAPVGV